MGKPEPAFVLAAPAKVNLTLEVQGLRPDGFHDVRSVMAAVSVADRLTFGDAPGGEVSLTGGTADAPPGEGNLVMRAAVALREAAGSERGAAIHLVKRIPVGAGLGGGSSDAAATLLGLNRLWRLGMPLTELAAIGTRLGSDVPFFLTGGTALAEGRGEILTPLEPPDLLLALVKPAASLSTPAVYRQWDAAPAAPARGTADRIAATLAAAGAGPEAVAPNLANDLQPAAVSLCPEVGDVLDLLRESGSMGAILSGSGSACFGLYRTREEAARAVEAARLRGWWGAVARTVRLPLEDAP